MEFQQLEMFAAVVEEGSIRRAAERVFRTGPAVSISLRKLEEEVGSDLFDRSERYNYVLTPAGEVLYSYVQKILEMRAEVASALNRLTQDRQRLVRIGTNEGPALYSLPPLTRAFHKAYPEIRIEVLSEKSERILASLREGQIDLALLAVKVDDPEFERKLILQDRLVLITSPTHPLAAASTVRIEDLAGEFLIVEAVTSSLRQAIMAAFRDAGAQPKIGVENVSLEMIKRIVAAGVGIAIVPLMCVREEEARAELSVIPLDGLYCERDLWIVHARNRPLTKAVRAFVNVTCSVDLSKETGQAGDRKIEADKGIRQRLLEEPERAINREELDSDKSVLRSGKARQTKVDRRAIDIRQRVRV